MVQYIEGQEHPFHTALINLERTSQWSGGVDSPWRASSSTHRSQQAHRSREEAASSSSSRPSRDTIASEGAICSLTGQLDVPNELSHIPLGELIPVNLDWSRSASREALLQTLAETYPAMRGIDVIGDRVVEFLPRGFHENSPWMKEVVEGHKRAKKEFYEKLARIDARHHPQPYLLNEINGHHQQAIVYINLFSYTSTRLELWSERHRRLNVQLTTNFNPDDHAILKAFKKSCLQFEFQTRESFIGAEAETLGACTSIYQWVWRHYHPTDGQRTDHFTTSELISLQHQANVNQRRRDAIQQQLDQMIAMAGNLRLVGVDEDGDGQHHFFHHGEIDEGNLLEHQFALHAQPEFHADEFRLLDEFDKPNLDLIHHAPEKTAIIEACEAVDLGITSPSRAMSLVLLAFQCARECAKQSAEIYRKMGEAFSHLPSEQWIQSLAAAHDAKARIILNQVIRWKAFIRRVCNHFDVSLPKLFQRLESQQTQFEILVGQQVAALLHK